MERKSGRKKWALIIIAVIVLGIIAKICSVVRFGPPVTISRETTYISAPLRPDGLPDYIAALNQRSSEGVTPENNVMTLFWQAVGPGEIDEEHREEYFRLLGIPEPPEQGDYFITSDKHEKTILARWAARQSPDEAIGEQDPEMLLNEQFSTARRRPWSRDEFPEWAEWIDANEKPLTLLIEATRRPCHYNPWFGEYLIASPLPGRVCARDVARALVARAMLRLNDGDTQGAWADLLACHRLGRFVGQGPGLVEALVSMTIEGIAYKGDQALLEHGQFDSDQLACMRKELSALPKVTTMVDVMNYGERFICLDVILNMAKEGPNAAIEGVANDGGTEASLQKSLTSVALDLNLMLRLQNTRCDHIVDACRLPTRAGRMAALAKLEKDLEDEIQKSRHWTSLVRGALWDSRATMTRVMGLMMAAIIQPSTSAGLEARDRAAMRFELTKLAFALAAFRADNGEYPEKLDTLAPKYMESLPKDIFNGDADLHYIQRDDGFLLYSVGSNGVDDGGKTSNVVQDNLDDIVVAMPADENDQ